MSINTDNENLLRAVPNMLPFTIPPLIVDGDFANLYLRQLLGIYPIAANVGQAEENFMGIADNNLDTVPDDDFDTVSRRD